MRVTILEWVDCYPHTARKSAPLLNEKEEERNSGKEKDDVPMSRSLARKRSKEDTVVRHPQGEFCRRRYVCTW